MNISEIKSIFSNLDATITETTKCLSDYYEQTDKETMITRLNKLNFDNAVTYQENRFQIIETTEMHVRYQLEENKFKHLWVKNPSKTHRYRIDISYDGTLYKGSQKQSKTTHTIQGVIEKILHHLFQEEVSIHFASRTDAKVHAYQNVAHFDASRNVDSDNYLNLINQMLPSDILVTSFKRVSSFFHARFDVLNKTYIYKYTFIKTLENMHKKRWIPFIQIEEIKAKLNLFMGTHDFKNFSKHREYDSTIRTITQMTLKEADDGFNLYITGEGFLRYMVRMISGALIKYDIKTISNALKYPNQEIGKHLYDADALYLKEIVY